jgi:hypothetical protein
MWLSLMPIFERISIQFIISVTTMQFDHTTHENYRGFFDCYLHGQGIEFHRGLSDIVISVILLS